MPNWDNLPLSPTLGTSVNPAKLDVANDEVATGASAAQTGGLLGYSYISLATINAVNVKASAGRLYGISVTNTNATARYVKLYDKATVPDPSAGDLPIWRQAILGTSILAPVLIPHGLAFANGLGFVIVTLLADTDETAVGANEVILNLLYK